MSIRYRYALNRLTDVDLGRQGENLARTIEIDITDMLCAYPDAQITLIVQRPNDGATYLAAATAEGGVLVWPITDADTAFSGTGKIEIRAAIGDVLAKSAMGTTRVSSSLTGGGSSPPDPAKPWVDRVLEAQAAAEASARDAHTAADRAEKAADSLEGAAQAWPEIPGEVEVLERIANGTYQGTDLTVKFAEEIAGFSNPWAWIRARIAAKDFSKIHVCDYIPFTTTNGLVFQAQIAGINTYAGYGDKEVKDHIDFISRELWPEAFPLNRVNLNNGTSEEKSVPWLASNGYLFVNSLAGQVPNSTTRPFEMLDVDYTTGGMYYYLPDELKAVINEKRVYAPARFSESGVLSNDNSGAWVNMGKLWLPDEYEITGARLMTSSGWFSGGFVQYPIFAHRMTRLKRVQGGNSRSNWWTSAAIAGNTANFVLVYTSGNVLDATASGARRAPFCFRVGG